MRIKITLNGKPVVCDSSQTILEVAQSQGVSLPTLCHDEKLEPFGSCWVCLVEVKGARGFIPSCATKAVDGMVVDTENERILAARRMALELLLSNHFGDCIGPCQDTCPARCDAQGYIALTANGQEEEAIRLIKQTLPLPASLGRVCPHPCEDECRRNLVDEPVAICAIKRHVADLDLRSARPYLPPVEEETGKKVVVVGGGPAGLTAAYYLRQKGHQVTILEALPRLGGWLRYGIPEYRLPKSVLDKEISTITALGVEIKTNTRLGKEVTLAELRRKYNAVFLGIGAHASVRMGLEGEEIPGVIAGIDFLKGLALGEKVSLGKTVAVIGGGNTAIDAARSSLRLGAERVTIFYRRTAHEMPANPMEVEEAKKEGIQFEFLTAPSKVLTCTLGTTGGLVCQRMELGAPDASGRRRPIPVPGSEFQIEADTVISCIGQNPDLSGIDEDQELKISRWGTIATEEESGATSLEGVFAAGDSVTGPATVVEAIGGARKAVEAIHSYLMEGKVGEEIKEFNLSKGKLKEVSPELYAHVERKPRGRMPMLPETERKDFAEVELGFSSKVARDESIRCLECGCADVVECRLKEYSSRYEAIARRFLGEIKKHPIDQSHPYIERDPNKCVMCGRCIRICAEVVGAAALGFVYRGFNVIMAPSLEQPLPETTCVSCGACIEACPVGALSERIRHLPRYPHLAMDEKPAICTYCGVGCGLIFNTKGGKIFKITGDRRSPVNYGALCFKGKFGFEFIQSEERLRKPLVRKRGKLRAASWDEALSEVNLVLERVLSDFGPESVAVFASGHSTNEELEILRLWGNKLGIGRFSSFQYAASRPLAVFSSVVGHSFGRSYEDLGKTGHVVLIGSDPYEEHPVLSQRIRQTAERGARLTILNERPTKLGEIAQKELLLKKGGLCWALNGLLKISLEREEARAADWQRLKRWLEKITFSAIEEKSGLDRQALNLLFEGIDRSGLFVFNADQIDETSALALGDLLLDLQRPRDFLAMRNNCNSSGLDRWINFSAVRVLKEVKEGKVKALFVLGEDPFASHGLPVEIKRALSSLEVMVVCDLFLTETARKADIVLPASSFAEDEGSFINSCGIEQHFLAAMEPVSGFTTCQVLRNLAQAFAEPRQERAVIISLPIKDTFESRLSRRKKDLGIGTG